MKLSKLFLLSCLLVAALGCRSSGVDPCAQLINASTATEAVLAPRMRVYIAGDTNLSETMREQLLALLVDWKGSIDAARSLHEGDLVLEPNPPAPPDVEPRP